MQPGHQINRLIRTEEAYLQSKFRLRLVKKEVWWKPLVISIEKGRIWNGKDDWERDEGLESGDMCERIVREFWARFVFRIFADLCVQICVSVFNTKKREFQTIGNNEDQFCRYTFETEEP